ncbi:VirB4 family type IV secretion system protein [Lactobacillus sp. PV037]|uniref:VirB4 family type IV secretion system protein n=1 Tax=Lactobacillus sp. PV037 TaxID=2594496 RepID=UPI002240C677|nr:hypothetical protein [Lactobacillus sp. PV037]
MGIFKKYFNNQDSSPNDEEQQENQYTEDSEYVDEEDYLQEDNESTLEDSVEIDDYLEEDQSLEYDEDGESKAEEDEYYKKRLSPSTEIGQPSLVNIIGNSYWATDDVMQEYFIMRETMRHRTYGMPMYVPPSAYPRQVDSDIFQGILAQGNVDLTMDIIPNSRAHSIKKLSNTLNIIEANAEYQSKKGQKFQQRENVTKYNDIDNLLNEIQFDDDRMFDVNTSIIVYGDSERDMNQNANTVEDLLAENGMSLTPYVRRVKSGFVENLPMGVRMPNLDDTFRPVNRKALSVMDMALNAAGRFNGGIPFGYNKATPSQNTEFLNIFGTEAHRPNSYNMGIVGETGAGKSTTNKVKIGRETAILGYEHRCIDPDGEYILLAKKLRQLNLNITSDAKFVINPCAVALTETPLEEEYNDEEEADHNLTSEELEELIINANDGRQVVTHEDGTKYVQKVNINQMISNVEGFVNEILLTSGANSAMNPTEAARLDEAIMDVINKLGITRDPSSLYQEEGGEVDNQYYAHLPKPEPTLSDIYQQLEKNNQTSQGMLDPKLSRLVDALKPYLRGGSKPIFDGQTYFGKGRSRTLNDYKFVNFNISELDGSLKRVAYYVITQYLWERWMKNPDKSTVKKVLDADEILQFIDDKTMFEFFERIVRRCRKRNGSLCWLTQDIERFQGNPQAKALVTNSEFMYILQTNPEHRELMKHAIDLTDGALDILTGHPKPGEGILRAEGESIWIQVNPTKEELDFAESNRAIRLEREGSNFIDLVNKKLE